MARSFNGTSDIAKSSSNPTTVTDNWTICAWVYLDSGFGTATVVSNGRDSGSGAGYSITVWSDGRAHGGLSFVAWVYSGVTLSSGSWEHILFTRKSGTSRCYINGDGSLSSTSASGPYTPANSWHAGAEVDGSNNPAGRYTKGDIAEAAIWDRALDDDEIAALGMGYAPSFFLNGLKAYEPLVGKESPENSRVSGSAGTLTLTGTAAGPHPPILYPATALVYPPPGTAPPASTFIPRVIFH